jgi:hypothetical protein
MSYKIFAILIYNKLSERIESMISDYQMGFMPNRSAIYNIHTIKQMYEKCYEYSIDIHNVFVDFKQAFDSVNMSLVSESLKEYRIPRKLIGTTALTLKNTTAKFKINNEVSESLIVNTGVKQGDLLSALLFSVIMDQVLKSLDIRGNI